jgi:multidrug efflux pump subunit AcrB
MLNFASKARPYFGAVVLTVALLSAGGIYSYTRMPSGVYPEVTFPRIAVVARLPGLSVPNMNVQVTQPLEQAVTTVLGVAQVRSKTIRGGSEIYIDFAPGTDMRRSEQLVWNRIGSIRSQFPADVELTVDQMTPSISPILSLVLTGGDSPSQLRDYAFYQLAPQIKNIPDVLYANVAGGDLREIEVEARPDDLLAAGMSAADLADQIGKAHRLQPVGRVEKPPFAFQILVNTQGETARDIEELIVSTKNNQPLRVRDVADVRILHTDRVLSIGFEGRDAVVITVFRRLGGNAVNISRDIAALVKKSGLGLPPGDKDKPPPKNIQATVVYDQAQFIDTAVTNVRDAIIIGSLFSVLILLAFLRSWRATLISALAIPTTLAITFLFLHWSGETLNLMSLGGLAVAIGLIIDDTVVVIENIARHLGPAAKARAAPALALNGPAPAGPHAATGNSQPQVLERPPDPVDAASREITGAVVGSTLTTVLVFVPLAFIVGVYGQFFASLSWSLSIAVLVSMVISLTLIPVFAAKFLAGRPMPEPGRVYHFVADLYEKMHAGSLRFPWVTLGLSLVAVTIGVILFTGIPNPLPPKEPGKPRAPLIKPLETGLMPAMDEGAFVLDYWAPSGTPLERTEAMVREIEAVLSKNPDVQSYVRRTGAELGLFATQTNRGDIQVILRPAEDDPVRLLTKPVRPKFKDIEKELNKPGGKEAIRKKYRRRAMADVMEEVEDEAKDSFGEHQLQVELVPIMQDELNDLSGANRPIEIKLFGPDYAKLRSLASDVGEKFENKGKGRGFKEVNSNVKEGNPDLMVRVDGAKAARLGLKADEVERQLRAMFSGQVATRVQESAVRITDVRVRYPDVIRFGRERFDPDQLLSRLIVLPAGTRPPEPTNSPLSGPEWAVPLSAVARVERVRTPDEQWRENQQPVVIVTTEQNEKQAGLGSMVADTRAWMKGIGLPAGYHWELGGHYLRQQEAFRSLFVVMVVAVLLIYIMLAFQFRSVVLPLLIFLEQPLSLVSGLFALWITNTPLNVSSYMGAILLIGLDMKNGILLVEYIQQLQRQGMALEPALHEAGRVRFRPILMTSLAAILGLFPLALGIGPGAQMQQPLAIMVMGGLTANLFFTRMVIRAGYLILERRLGHDTPAPGAPVAPPDGSFKALPKGALS